jgi:uncharacterized protein YcbK (DUF882 family)
MRWVVVFGAMLVTACAMPVTQATEATGGAAPTQRFFVTGSDGRFVIQPRGAKDRTTIQYRRADGTYDEDAIARLRRILRSKDGGERTPPLRLVEVLGRVWELGGRRTLVLNSGYRSPTYNEGLRNRGRKAAGGSMHTEAMATDVAIPGADLQALWLELRELECCGVGFYGKDGFLHIDVGQPRFWESNTSGVEKNLSAGNARLFARTDWDRYGARAAIAVSLHSLTAPPVGIASAATMVFDDGERVAVTLRGDGGSTGDCMEISGRDAVLHAAAPARAGKGRLELRTCPPQPESTPAEVWSNPMEVVGEMRSK